MSSTCLVLLIVIKFQRRVNIFHRQCFFIPKAWLPQTGMLAVPQILRKSNEYLITLTLKQNPS